VEFKNHYSILGVSRDANKRAIEAAYRTKLRELEPEFDADTSDSTLGEVKEAYRVLSNTLRKRMYDSNLAKREASGKQEPSSAPSREHRTVERHTGDDVTSREADADRRFTRFVNDGVGFPIELNLAGGEHSDLANAARAVLEEYRVTSRWKRLHCRKVTLLEDDTDARIYKLQVGRGLQFDWTWEGAFAFRPINITDSLDEDALDLLAQEASDEASRVVSWQGEVVEVNEVEGEIYVSAEDSEHEPTIGAFYVRPFEFLEALHTVFSDEDFAGVRTMLPGRLNAARGKEAPLIASTQNASLPEFMHVWKHGWGILWGPPGTGKTHSIGRQVAASLADPHERILVVSTTNKATDGAALSIGRALLSTKLEGKQLVRIGKNADYERFERENLDWMLEGGETDLLRRSVELKKRLKQSLNNEERAKTRQELQRIQRALRDRALDIFLSSNATVVISTAFRAITLLRQSSIKNEIEAGRTPFTTIIIDEASLLPRVTTAALSLLASRRVLLVGDPMQLAPISKMSRVLPTAQAVWLARSGLNHLDSTKNLAPSVHLLTKQYRMHPDIRKVVSEYQYDRLLEDAVEVQDKYPPRDLFGEGLHRALWYVLDEEETDSPAIRAERGPANRSWMRQITRSVLEKILLSSEFPSQEGLFISPFAAQAANIRAFFAETNLEEWTASTVHSQQGAEARTVIFDTVNASSTAWPAAEWKRLVNVGISRSQEQLVVLASREEMQQPFLRPLATLLTPVKAVRNGSNVQFVRVPALRQYQAPDETLRNPELLGHQVKSRKTMRPILSSDQQRLSRLRMDGKPRLVRGVAGSGKTMVLANWLSQAVKDLQNNDDKVWVVFANYALKGLIEDTIERAWENSDPGRTFPWDRVDTIHVDEILKSVLDQLRRSHKIYYQGDQFDYDAKSALYLQHFSSSQIEPRCAAMFVDEAQDMGSNTLRLLAALVAQSDPRDPNSRAMNIFYDNAQNVYGRSTPKWSDLGLDMRGRSTVMRESFRSTQPITEYALNVLYELQPPDGDPEHRELVDRQLIEKHAVNGHDWWKVRFAQTNGPVPVLKRFSSLDGQINAISNQIIQWVKDEAITPGDICLLYNGSDVKDAINSRLSASLSQQGIALELLTGRHVQLDSNRILATTTHSFKGYDAEIVVIVSADRFVGSGDILANVLYTAMTRSRSLLHIYTNAAPATFQGATINTVLTRCIDDLLSTHHSLAATSTIDDVADLLDIVGIEHEAWLRDLWKQHVIIQEPLMAEDGELLAQPAFWFQSGKHTYTCFGNLPLGQSTRYRLEDRKIVVLKPGQTVPIGG
jgi:curved DNA-binding protein CbpA